MQNTQFKDFFFKKKCIGEEDSNKIQLLKRRLNAFLRKEDDKPTLHRLVNLIIEVVNTYTAESVAECLKGITEESAFGKVFTLFEVVSKGINNKYYEVIRTQNPTDLQDEETVKQLRELEKDQLIDLQEVRKGFEAIYYERRKR